MSTKNYEKKKKKKFWDKLSRIGQHLSPLMSSSPLYIYAGLVLVPFSFLLCEIKPLFMFTSKASLRLYIAAAAWLVSTLG